MGGGRAENDPATPPGLGWNHPTMRIISIPVGIAWAVLAALKIAAFASNSWTVTPISGVATTVESLLALLLLHRKTASLAGLVSTALALGLLLAPILARDVLAIEIISDRGCSCFGILRSNESVRRAVALMLATAGMVVWATSREREATRCAGSSF